MYKINVLWIFLLCLIMSCDKSFTQLLSVDKVINAEVLDDAEVVYQKDESGNIILVGGKLANVVEVVSHDGKPDPNTQPAQTEQQNTQTGQQNTQTGQQNTQTGQQNTQTEQQNTQTEQQNTQTEQQDTQTEQQNTQTEQQNTQTEQQNTQTEQQNTQTEQQDTQTEQQDTQTEQQNTQTEQQNTQTEQQDTQTEQQDTQTEQQDTQTKQKNTQTKQKNTQTKQKNTQTKQKNTQTKQQDPNSQQQWDTQTEQEDPNSQQQQDTQTEQEDPNSQQQQDTQTEQEDPNSQQQQNTQAEQKNTQTEQKNTQTEQQNTQTEQQNTQTEQQDPNSLQQSTLTFVEEESEPLIAAQQQQQQVTGNVQVVSGNNQTVRVGETSNLVILRTYPGARMAINVPSGMGYINNMTTPGMSPTRADASGYVEFTFTPSKAPGSPGPITLTVSIVRSYVAIDAEITFTILDRIFLIIIDMSTESDQGNLPTSTLILRSVIDEHYGGMTNYLSDKIVAMEVDPSNNFRISILKNESGTSNATYTALSAQCISEYEAESAAFLARLDAGDEALIEDYLYGLSFDLWRKFRQGNLAIEEAVAIIRADFQGKVASTIAGCITAKALEVFTP